MFLQSTSEVSDLEMDHFLINALLYPAKTPVLALETHICTLCEYAPVPKTGSKSLEAKTSLLTDPQKIEQHLIHN